MIVVDSSGWIEYANDGPSAAAFEPAILATSDLVVPTIVMYEVTKVLRRSSERTARATLGVMLRSKIVDLDASGAVHGANVSLETGLAMADAIILATARAHGAELWTMDAHFEGLPGVRYIALAGD